VFSLPVASWHVREVFIGNAMNFIDPANFSNSVCFNTLKVKCKAFITGLDRPIGFQEVEAPRFQYTRHMKVVRLSALRTGQLYPPGIITGTQFC
jgi:hypothetical protein